MDLESVADELYGLPLDEFTPTRNARAKQARAEGDRDLATSIQRLPKPTTAAWLVNQLSRELADQLRPLIELGRDLRDATSNLSGDDLRTLTRQRHEVVHALVQQARRMGSDRGQRVSDDVAAEVQRTLEASLADPDIAESVLAGQLSRAADYAGFGVPGGGERERRQPAGRAASRQAEVTDLAERRRAAAEREERTAARRADAARAAYDRATEQRSKAAEALEVAQQEVDERRAALEQAEHRVRESEEADRSARERARRAGEDVKAAEQEHADAEAALRDMSPQ